MFQHLTIHNYGLWQSVLVRFCMRKKQFWSFLRKNKRWWIYVPWLSQESVFFTNSYIFVCYFIHHGRQASWCLSSRLHQFKCCNMLPTLDVFHCLFMTNCTALHWTISNWSILLLLKGFQAEQALKWWSYYIFKGLFLNGGQTDIKVST